MRTWGVIARAENVYVKRQKAGSSRSLVAGSKRPWHCGELAKPNRMVFPLPNPPLARRVSGEANSISPLPQQLPAWRRCSLKGRALRERVALPLKTQSCRGFCRYGVTKMPEDRKVSDMSKVQLCRSFREDNSVYIVFKDN
jgi:hypothetical protein